MYLDATSYNTGYTSPSKVPFGKLHKNINPDSILSRGNFMKVETLGRCIVANPAICHGEDPNPRTPHT